MDSSLEGEQPHRLSDAWRRLYPSGTLRPLQETALAIVETGQNLLLVAARVMLWGASSYSCPRHHTASDQWRATVKANPTAQSGIAVAERPGLALKYPWGEHPRVSRIRMPTMMIYLLGLRERSTTSTIRWSFVSPGLQGACHRASPADTSSCGGYFSVLTCSYLNRHTALTEVVAPRILTELVKWSLPSLCPLVAQSVYARLCLHEAMYGVARCTRSQHHQQGHGGSS